MYRIYSRPVDLQRDVGDCMLAISHNGDVLVTSIPPSRYHPSQHALINVHGGPENERSSVQYAAPRVNELDRSICGKCSPKIVFDPGMLGNQREQSSSVYRVFTFARGVYVIYSPLQECRRRSCAISSTVGEPEKE